MHRLAQQELTTDSDGTRSKQSGVKQPIKQGQPTPVPTAYCIVLAFSKASSIVPTM